MTMIYSNPARENEAGVQPDVEVYVHNHIGGSRHTTDDADACAGSGWYWRRVVLLSLGSVNVADGDPNGPFDTEVGAITAARGVREVIREAIRQQSMNTNEREN
jgi:hypothetical protein